MAKKTKKENLEWNVLMWDFNQDALITVDIVPFFKNCLKSVKKNDRPKTKEEFNEFIKKEAKYYFWAKCEYEMIIHGWPKQKNNEKVDVYNQLVLNWDVFIDNFWNSLQTKKLNASHRKQRGRTAPNRALKKGSK